ncbi:hypothetical protein GJV85_02265 [Sulfurimonas aquatica]|uniref:Uncharacterized protein n=1 Tax=Sulfurimonas aquatica TaxID=2672570 RepID=A0A975B2P4_9BACT|nr:hypothetical protein GJV85_02265 [Sulfurimonas aquatica]
MKIEHIKIYCEIASSKSVVARATKVSFVVGTTLNLINQGDSLIALDLINVSIIKLVLTYFVPYGVTTYTATAMKVEFQIGTKAIVDADLQCVNCKQEIHVDKDEIIPECKSCGIKTHWQLK